MPGQPSTRVKKPNRKRRLNLKKWLRWARWGFYALLTGGGIGFHFYLRAKANANLAISQRNSDWQVLRLPNDNSIYPRLELVAFPTANYFDGLAFLNASESFIKRCQLGIDLGDCHHYAFRLIEPGGNISIYECMFENRPQNTSQMALSHLENSFHLKSVGVQLTSHNFGSLQAHRYTVDKDNPAFPIQTWSPEAIRTIGYDSPCIVIAQGARAQALWDDLSQIQLQMNALAVPYAVDKVDSNTGILYVFQEWQKSNPDIAAQLESRNQLAPRLPLRWATGYNPWHLRQMMDKDSNAK